MYTSKFKKESSNKHYCLNSIIYEKLHDLKIELVIIRERIVAGKGSLLIFLA